MCEPPPADVRFQPMHSSTLGLRVGPHKRSHPPILSMPFDFAPSYPGSTPSSSRSGSHPESPWASVSEPQSSGLQTYRSQHARSSSSTHSSVSSASSGSEISDPLKDAVANKEPIIHFNKSGEVSSGTLEGLIQRLIEHCRKSFHTLIHKLLVLMVS